MPPSGIGTGLCKSPGAKGGASTTLYPPAGRPPDHAPHLCKTAQRADSESRAWKASLLCTVAEHLDVRKWPPKMWGMVRATARVPTPLHTTPALTMIHGESRSLRPHSKGGGGVERGGDPCGRPGGRESLCVTLSSPIPCQPRCKSVREREGWGCLHRPWWEHATRAWAMQASPLSPDPFGVWLR